MRSNQIKISIKLKNGRLPVGFASWHPETFYQVEGRCRISHMLAPFCTTSHLNFQQRQKENVSEATEQLWILSSLSYDHTLHLKQLRLLTRSGFTQRLMLFITLWDKCSPSGRMVRPGSSAPQLMFYVTFNGKSLIPPQRPDIKYHVLMIL